MASVFDEANANLTEACFGTFGEATVFTNAENDDIDTRVVFSPNTAIVGDAGVILDPRPSAELPVADVGVPNVGSFTYQGQTYALDGLIGDDGVVGRWFVRKTS